MRNILRKMCAVCLLTVLLSTCVITVRAADTNGVEHALQRAVYYDEEAGEIRKDAILPAVFVRVGDVNCVFTSLPPRDDLRTAIITADQKAFLTTHTTSFSETLHLYETASKLGQESGFYPVGVVTKDEPVKCIFYNKDSKMAIESTTATGLKDGKLELKERPSAGFYPVLVANSQNEICAVLDKEVCFSLVTDEDIFYNRSQETQPPETQPSETQPPETQPSETQPPATQPPETQPSEEDPSMIKIAGELPDLDDIYFDAVKQKEEPSNLGTLAIAGVGALIVILTVVVVLVKRKNAKIAEQNSNTLNEAEEGTQLADDFVDTGLRLQFRSGKRVAVRQNFTIGRAPDNGVVIAQQSTGVSGHHCGIVLQDGRAFLRDMGSTNGTFVNGRRIPAGQLVPLQPGMRVSLGGVNSPECFDVVLSSKLTGEK